MKLFHSTPTENVESILKKGLIPFYTRQGDTYIESKDGIVYLAPTLETVYKKDGNTILEVETGELRLSAFDDCRDWEVLCWGSIPPEDIKVVQEVLKK